MYDQYTPGIQWMMTVRFQALFKKSNRIDPNLLFNLTYSLYFFTESLQVPQNLLDPHCATEARVEVLAVGEEALAIWHILAGTKVWPCGEGAKVWGGEARVPGPSIASH